MSKRYNAKLPDLAAGCFFLHGNLFSLSGLFLLHSKIIYTSDTHPHKRNNTSLP
ncbi:hypothetical protein HMPREF0201_01274 [Cedecea davisae DSM 4568]|uniref:Uncharacterized protein n=1 Tax=Cedecea davisae DSM 4568 TaxID=566551 RepID=S3K084_9ENTR|nr:hypothetical protein HMPREF0201_01274 [Cedecea davisae DSM 4568]